MKEISKRIKEDMELFMKGSLELFAAETIDEEKEACKKIAESWEGAMEEK